MSATLIFDVQYQFIKSAPTPGPGNGGPANIRGTTHRALVAAASGHPKDILTVLNADVTIPGGFSIDIVSVQSASIPGTEGSSVLS